MAASPIIAGDLLGLVRSDERIGDPRRRRQDRTPAMEDRAPPGEAGGCATPIGTRPAEGPATPGVPATTALGGYQPAMGAPRGWTPLAPRAGGAPRPPPADTVLISTLNTNEPWMTTFDA